MIESNKGHEAVQGLAPNRLLGPKPFAECDTTEQIKRLVEEVRGWRNVCHALQMRVNALEGHAHGPTGQLMVPLHHASSGVGQLAAQAWDTLR